MGLNVLKLKILTIALITSLLLPLSALAEPSMLATPVMVDLRKDQKAPFAGTLLNPRALAEIASVAEFSNRDCKLKVEFAEQREKAKCDLAVGNIDASQKALELQYSAILDIKNEEVRRLTEIAIKQPNSYSHWWFSGGVVAGIVTSIAIFYASIQIQQ